MEKKSEDIQIVRNKEKAPRISKDSPPALNKKINNDILFLKSIYPCFRSSLYFLVPSWIFILLQSLSLLSDKVSDLGSQILAVLVFTLGIPLSIALRVDQLSLELGTHYPRELILFLASLLMGVNITLVLYLRKLILNFRK